MAGPDFRLEDFVSREAIESAPRYAHAFQSGRPFRHVVIDGFLNPGYCGQLCAQFPEFQDAHAINENERVGGKATRENVRSLGTAFVEADDLVRNPAFLSLIEGISGVEDLHYDPFYFGGGTHENRAGQELDPHIDFNYHPVTSQHRRLNLIVYLNEEWLDDWGGSLQLHRDPYCEPGQDEVVTVTPLMNRCVIFETSENSWHGFDRIRLPEDKSHLSRRSFAVYYYTDTRPHREIADEHSTVYVERHLPPKFEPGLTLGATEVRELKQILRRRDMHLQRLYQDIQSLYAERNRLRLSGSGKSARSLDLGEIPEDLRSAVQMIQVLRHRVNDLEASTSWRLTSPIRAIKRLLMRNA